MTRHDIFSLYSAVGCRIIALRGKKPLEPNWPEAQASVSESDFRTTDNVGLLTGSPSGGIVDVDIDNLDALTLAPHFLPPTNCTFGRCSKPKSHRIYRVPDPANIETRQYGGMIVELRGDRHQTMVPPSVHPSGEAVEFSDFGEPAETTWSALESAITQLAIATLLKPFWVGRSRHKLALNLARGLKCARWKAEQAYDFVEKLCKAFNDKKTDDRRRCVETTFDTAGSVFSEDQLAEIITSPVEMAVYTWSKMTEETPSIGRQLKPHGEFATEDDYATAFANADGCDLFFLPQTGIFYKKRDGVFVPIPLVEVYKDFNDHGTF